MKIHVLSLSLLLFAAMPAAHAGKGKVCTVCGKVTAVTVLEKDGEGGAAGMLVGGVAGAVLGNQIGSGGGRQVATVAGAAGGAYAGKQIEGKMNATRTWTVNVRYNNGKHGSFSFSQDPGMQVGDKVRKSKDSLIRA